MQQLSISSAPQSLQRFLSPWEIIQDPDTTRCCGNDFFARDIADGEAGGRQWKLDRNDKMDVFIRQDIENLVKSKLLQGEKAQHWQIQFSKMIKVTSSDHN